MESSAEVPRSWRAYRPSLPGRDEVRAFAVRVAVRHGLIAALYADIVLVLIWPMFGPGSPPGVDSPTFLHLGWVVEKALTGDPGLLLSDPYWYGGWPYLAAYPPLAYGAIGLLSAISPISIEVSFRIFAFLAYVGMGLTVYALALELGVRKWIAVWGGALSLFSYAMFVSLGIFGWYSTVFALPFGVAGFTMLERSLRTVRRRDAVWAGLLLAASLLSHHMTGLVFAVGLAPWAVYVLWPKRTRARRFRMLLTTGIVAFVLALPWLALFIPHLINVGFEREIAGNWNVDVAQMFRRSMERSFIGREAYPTYIGLVQLPLAVAGIAHAFSTRSRAIGTAIVLLIFGWFALGSAAMPLIDYYPFSGLDVARFVVFMAPLMAVMAAYFVDAVLDDVVIFGGRIGFPARLAMPTAIVGMLLLLFIPIQDSLRARDTLIPVGRIPQVDLAFDWIKENTPEDTTLLAVGFRNWDDWWVPVETERRVMDGWNDEGAPSWRQVREVRLMGWRGNVSTLRFYDIMDARDTDYLLIYHWQPLDSPQLFELAAIQDRFLFQPAQSWPGVSLYQRIDR